MKDDALLFNREHADSCHARWSQSGLNNANPEVDEEGNPPDEWSNYQCGQCVYYILVVGALSSDWGLCSNAKSKFDRMAMFEHDGCDEYKGANTWVSSYKPSAGLSNKE